MTMQRIQVAVPGPFHTPLTYLSKRDLQPGMRVEVPLGRRRVLGIVLGPEPEPAALPEERLRLIERVLDEVPALDVHQLALGHWLAAYYHAPIGEVMALLLPVALRSAGPLWHAGQRYWQLTAAGRALSVEELPARAVRQRRLLTWLQQQAGPISVEQLRAFMPESWAPLQRFVERGWVEAQIRPCRASATLEDVKCERHLLNAAQQSVVDEIVLDRFGVHLLQGVTGSGKTAVYLALAEKVLAQGRQVLVMVPEISLTPQMVQRFQAWLQQPVAVLHSAMSAAERHCQWTLLAQGQVRVALGTRSAVLSRFDRLGLIVVDEEHDPSYRQQEGVRYSGRDVAIWLARHWNIPIVLGSATPALESLHRVRTGRWRHHLLPHRAGGAEMPTIGLLDIRGAAVEAGVSAPLRQAIHRHLSAGRQVMLFLNRRGFAPVMMCHQCGWQADCPACSAHLTWHRDPPQLRCHHCDFQARVPDRCPRCGSGTLVAVGQGTARLESALAATFEVPVIRIDRDSTRRRGTLEERLEQVRAGEPLILVGTQMLAKGHHFPHVTLVGMLEVDQALFSPDFRAPERLAQQLIQVAGRAGRGHQRGEVLIETRQPAHPLLQTLITGGYEAFAERALQERAEAGLPPFSHQVLIRASAFSEETVRDFLLQVAAQWRGPAEERGVMLWGPVAAPMIRRRGRWCYQLLLQSARRALLHRLLDEMMAWLRAHRGRRVRWSVDVDPLDLM